jgi:hypothetical protein
MPLQQTSMKEHLAVHVTFSSIIIQVLRTYNKWAEIKLE